MDYVRRKLQIGDLQASFTRLWVQSREDRLKLYGVLRVQKTSLTSAD